MSRTLAEADVIVGLGLDPVELIRPWHATAPSRGWATAAPRTSWRSTRGGWTHR